MHCQTLIRVPNACKANTPVNVSGQGSDDVNISKISIKFSIIWL